MHAPSAAVSPDSAFTGGVVTADIAIGRILAPHASPLARLGLPPDAAQDRRVLQQAYRAVARLVHPDKSAHSRAKLAFQLVSEAFDRLAEALASGKAWSRDLGAAASASRRRHTSDQEDSHPPPWDPEPEVDAEEVDERGERGDRRWWDAGWSEFEERLRQRELQAQQLEAMEAAVGRGEDSLDAYMAVLAEELARGEEVRVNASGQGSARSTPERPKDARGPKRPHPASRGSATCFSPAAPSAAVRCRREAPKAATPGEHLSVRLATGQAVVVSASSKAQEQRSFAACRGPGVLDHLDSDGSEIES